MTIPVLIYQMDVEFGNPEMNLNKIKTMLAENTIKPGTFVILPELFLTGYHAGAIEDLTKSDQSEYLEKLLKLTRENQIMLFGSIPMSYNGEPYNTAILIDQGDLIDTYQKSHLFGPMGEKELFRAGRNVEITNIEDINIGMSICYDLRFPELYKKQVELGAELLLICAEWPIQRVDHWVTLARARAIENQCMVIACNRVGDDPDYHFGGHSVVYDSFGEEIIAAKHDEEAILQLELEVEELTGFRSNFETAIDRWI